MKTINTSECEKCKFCTIEENGGAVKIHCSSKDKEYYYGQRIMCEEREVNGRN